MRARMPVKAPSQISEQMPFAPAANWEPRTGL
jgi:hypothetical protein